VSTSEPSPPRRRGFRSLRWLLSVTLTAASAVTVLALGVTPAEATTTPGIDVSHYQGTINWTSVRNAGIQWAYIKATEGTSYKDSAFNTNYPNAYYAGVIRGAYHFARPDISSGATQADFFANNGGAWSADNRTLPGALDIEYNPYGSTCYGLSQSSMVSWISAFLNRYHYRTGRWAVIYSTTNWWSTCTGNYGGFASHDPLWIARYSSSPGTLPNGWSFWTMWQYTSSGSVSGISGSVDRDYFNGDRTRLLALANNTP
jgi:GH25 family lysozyme M1 (1,4-beta-N-acetylmuramidase)